MHAVVGAFFLGLSLGIPTVLLVEWHATRAERIYRARHRDHSKVPAIK